MFDTEPTRIYVHMRFIYLFITEKIFYDIYITIYMYISLYIILWIHKLLREYPTKTEFDSRITAGECRQNRKIKRNDGINRANSSKSEKTASLCRELC